MQTRTRNFFYALTTILLLAFLIFMTYWQNRPAPPVNNGTEIKISDREKAMEDPDLLFASFTDSGLCGGPNGEDGSCSFNAYLYNTGKYASEASFMNYAHEVTFTSSSKQISEEKLEKVTDLIRNSGIIDMKCEPQLFMDAWFSYFINLDGEKRFFDDSPPPECMDIFEQIDKLIDG